jgi:hypothetical protein
VLKFREAVEAEARWCAFAVGLGGISTGSRIIPCKNKKTKTSMCKIE